MILFYIIWFIRLIYIQEGNVFLREDIRLFPKLPKKIKMKLQRIIGKKQIPIMLNGRNIFGPFIAEEVNFNLKR